MDVQTSSTGPAKVIPLQVLTLNENSEIQPAFCTYGYADHDTCVMLTHFYVKKPGNLSLKLVVIEPNGDRSVWNFGKVYVDQGIYYAWAQGWFGMPGNHRMKWVYKTGTLTKKVKGKFIVFECAGP